MEQLVGIGCKKFALTEHGFEVEFQEKNPEEIEIDYKHLDIEEMRRLVNQADEDLLYGSSR